VRVRVERLANREHPRLIDPQQHRPQAELQGHRDRRWAGSDSLPVRGKAGRDLQDLMRLDRADHVRAGGLRRDSHSGRAVVVALDGRSKDRSGARDLVRLEFRRPSRANRCTRANPQRPAAARSWKSGMPKASGNFIRCEPRPVRVRDARKLNRWQWYLASREILR